MSAVLVVDDDADIRLLYRLMLQRRGYEVWDAASAESGLERLEADCPDFMLLDIRMPGMDGWEMLAQVRSAPRLHDLKVIVCSAHASPADERRAVAEGASAFLTKPFPEADLLQLLDYGSGSGAVSQ